MLKKFWLCSALLLAMVGCAKRSEKWDMVVYARGGQIEETRLVLEDLPQYVSVFTVGKPRQVVSVPLQDIVSEWDKLFSTSEPNATLSIRTAQNEAKELVVVLKKPQLINGQLVFVIEQKHGHLVGSISEIVLFVDNIVCTLVDCRSPIPW